jgi:hypothetical protein
MTIQANIEAKQKAMDDLQAHCMCASAEYSPHYIMIIYPYGDWPVDGIRVENSAAGIGRALTVMEKHWQGSFL